MAMTGDWEKSIGSHFLTSGSCVGSSN